MRRTYNQYCTLARALDVVGERWTLLLVRELLVRPKRFSELLDGLPGIGRNLLAARLRYLEAEALVRRVESESGGARLYELTEDGRGLAPALGDLARWGAGRLGTLRPGEIFQGQWAMNTMVVTADRHAARDVRETYQFDVEGDIFHLRVENGRVTANVGAAEAPDLIIRTAPETLANIAAGTHSLVEALRDGALTFEGPPASLERALAIFGPAWGVAPEVSP